MEAAFYISAGVAVAATVMAITRLHAMHALLYLIASLLAVAVALFTLGSPFIAALEIVIYAGAIMVLFIFVVMMLNLGPRSVESERRLLKPRMWIGPGALSALLLAEFIYAIAVGPPREAAGAGIGPKQVGIALYGPYIIGVELASLLLMAALIGAYHLGWRGNLRPEDEYGRSARGVRTAAGRDVVHAGAGGIAGAPQRSVHADLD